MNRHPSSIPYYDHNAEKYAARANKQLDLDALNEFTSRIPAGGKILDAACGTGRDLLFFRQHGFDAEGFDGSEKMVALAQQACRCRVWRADLLLLSLPKETYDGIWAHQAFQHLHPEGCLRVMASFFAALKHGGHLFVSIEESEKGNESEEDRLDDSAGPARIIYGYRADDFASLLRQCGLSPLAQGRSIAEPRRIGFIAKRV